MENKKTHTADPEEKRITGFLLGLILVLSLLFVAFEYNSRPAGSSSRAENPDELSQDIELHPAFDSKEMVSAAPAVTRPAVTERIKAVERPLKEQIERLSPNTADPLLSGDGEAQAHATNATEALPRLPLNSDPPISFRVVEQLPEFPGGASAFILWLTRTLQYPSAAQAQNIQGKVVVSFIVNKDGSIADVKLEKPLHPLLDREALRVIRMMPKWKPGLQNNQPCRTMVAVPVVFKI